LTPAKQVVLSSLGPEPAGIRPSTAPVALSPRDREASRTNTIQSFVDSGARAALVIAHPGHELRVYGWLERARPTVFILTDGSGHTGSSRLPTTSQVLAETGATRGSIYGALTDEALYAAIIHHEYGTFRRLVEQLAEALSDPTTDYVVGDAMEGYNPGHDVCRLLIDRAVTLARHRGSRISSFAFKLTGSPAPLPGTPGGEVLRLDPASLARKIAAARRYAELAEEVEAALFAFGAEAFRNEHMPPAGASRAVVCRPPFYERRGERQVADRHYHEVLRYEEHVRPLMAALGAGR
jgi:hypothetical protein